MDSVARYDLVLKLWKSFVLPITLHRDREGEKWWLFSQEESGSVFGGGTARLGTLREI